MSDKTKTIRELNDKFRAGDITIPGQWLVTSGLTALLEESETAPEDLLHVVRSYDDFTPDNDPHQEHEFGVFDFQGERCFWKIDYYDPTLKWGSDNPADLIKTRRVLTILMASEY